MKTALASVLAAGVASACCIGPVAFVLLGVGTFGASLAALEPYRPVLLTATAQIAAKQVGGVKDAKASYAKGTAEVTYDSAKTSPDAIAKAIAPKTGYKTEVAK